MPVLIYYSEPNEQHDENNQIQYSPPTLEVSLDPEEVMIVRHKRLDEMTREDVDAEIHWAESVFEPDLRNRGFAGPLIDILLQIIADGIVFVENRLDAAAQPPSNAPRD